MDYNHCKLQTANCKLFQWECLAITNWQLHVAAQWFELEVVSLEDDKFSMAMAMAKINCNENNKNKIPKKKK